MRKGYTMDDAKRLAEIEAVKLKTDQELEDYAAENVSGAAVLSSRGFGWCSYDQKCDIAYDEAQRRGKPELYTRGYKRAGASHGINL